jgi:predicted phage-related endonuclease
MGATPKNISGSRSAGICGLSKWSSVVDEWLTIEEELEPGFCDKNGYIKPVRQDNPFLTWGLAFEDAICQKIFETTRYTVNNREREDEILDGICTCHRDGDIEIDYDRPRILIENKTTSSWAFRDEWGEEDSDVIPVNYGIQVQHNMMVTGLPVCWLFVLIFPVVQTELDKLVNLSEVDKKKWVDVLAEMGLLKRFIIRADTEIQEMLRERYREFWNENVLKQIPPEPVSMLDLRKLLPRKFGECVAPPRIAHLVNTYRDMSEEENRVKPIKENIRVRILNYMRLGSSRLMIKTHPITNRTIYCGKIGPHDKNLRLLSENGRVLATYSRGRFTIRRGK